MISASKIKARYNKAKSRRSNWVDLFATAYDYSCPQRETFYFHSEGEQKNAEVYDSTAIEGVQKFAGRMQSAMIPPWQNWGNMVAGSEIPEEEKKDLNEQLKKATEIFFTNIHHSNLSNQAHEAFIDLSISTGALLMNENPDPTGSAFAFEAVALSQLYLEEGPNGTVQNVYRDQSVMAGNLTQIWPDIKLDDELDRMAREKPQETIDLLEATIYDPKTRKYEYALVYKTKKILERTYNVSPWIIFRWSVAPNEVYGRGPIIHILPDILTVNKAVEFKLRAGAQAVAGTWTGRDDGIMNPYNVQITPNTVIPVNSNDQRNPSLARLDTGADFNISELIIQDLRAGIKRVLLDDDLPPMEGAVRSLGEIQIRDAKSLQYAGANYGRMVTEMLVPIFNRGMDILAKAGKMPADLRIDGKKISVQFESPLARAQRNDELMSLQDANNLMGMEGSETKAIWFKTSKYLDKVLTLLGHNDLMNSEDEAEANIKKLTDAAMAAQGAPVAESEPA